MRREEADPFRIPVTEEHRWGMPPVLDESPFRFGRDSEHFRGLLADLGESIPGEVIASYGKQASDHPLALENWRLGCLLEWWADNDRAPTFEACSALALALGIGAHARTLEQAYEAILRRAEKPGEPWKAIAAEVGLKDTKLFNILRAPAARELLSRAQSIAESGGALDASLYPGAEWIDPPGENGWRDEVEHICQDVIYRVGHAGRHVPVDLRRAIHVVVLWHALAREPLGTTVLKATATVMGLRNGRTIGRFEPDEVSIRVLAELDAGSPASVSERSRQLGTSRTNIARWRRDSPIYREHFDKARS